jgi:hypothetical protein
MIIDEKARDRGPSDGRDGIEDRSTGLIRSATASTARAQGA